MRAMVLATNQPMIRTSRNPISLGTKLAMFDQASSMPRSSSTARMGGKGVLLVVVTTWNAGDRVA